ncbi:failed axon connections homolog [Haliotis asinina]|uniref:failed axon connections homolog n=1 Tax=Haliotis asinina TaxID=109174 RepID=UPI003531CFC2
MATFNGLDSSQKVLYVAGGAVVAIVTIVGLRKLCFKKLKAKKYPRDTVILHQPGRGPYAPSLSPFALKLETYLRMAKIPYQNVHGMKPSSKGKFPWIEYNGLAVADTSLCIQFLNQKFGVDFNGSLIPAERGVAQAMQVMVEEQLFLFHVLFRWKFENDKSLTLKTAKVGRLTAWMAGKIFMRQVTSAGFGQHTEEEINEMFRKDLQSLSDFIGTKKFLMGDEPCETDCAVFGQVAVIYWQFYGTRHATIIKDKYPNLASYCERMKDTFWPDWDECHTHGGTREAVK